MRRWAGTRLPLLIALLALAWPARAVDGVTEISQACVANGCFGGDAPGYPVTISTPGSYRLTGSLRVRDTGVFAIRVSSDVHDVTIDLNGFSISGPTVCSGYPVTCTPVGAGIGIDAQNSFRVSVRNGVVQGFGGFGLLLSAQARVIDVSATSNGQTGLAAGAGSIIERCVVFENGGRGIDCSDCVVRKNTVRGNVAEGIRGSSGSVIEGNSITLNGGVGLWLDGGTSGYVNNVIHDNHGGNANPQVTGGIELGKNICGLDAVCP
jgi:hypothetical protein